MEPASGWHRGPGRHFSVLGAQSLLRDPTEGTFGASLSPLGGQVREVWADTMPGMGQSDCASSWH